MNTVVQQWFALEMIHDYFDQNKCTVLQLDPMKETSKTMKNYKIRIHQQGNIYSGYVETDTTGSVALSLPLEKDLFFKVRSMDTHFATYTKEIESKEENTVRYFTNTASGDAVTLSSERCNVQSLRFNVTLPKTTPAKVLIKNRKDEEIVQFTSQKEQQSMSIDLRDFGTGIYQLWFDDRLIQKFLGISEAIPLDCYGIVHFQVKSLVTVLKNNTIPKLKMEFEARKVFWQYAIIVPSDKKITVKSLNVIDSGGGKYAGPEQKKIGIQEAVVFTSVTPLPLRQKIKTPPLLKMQYTNDFSRTLLDMDIKMPLPGISNIKTNQESNGKDSYSQAIVYV